MSKHGKAALVTVKYAIPPGDFDVILIRDFGPWNPWRPKSHMYFKTASGGGFGLKIAILQRADFGHKQKVTGAQHYFIAT